MARPPKLAPEQIRQTIQELAAEGAELSITAVRERLGTGSYSTIGAVLNDWRRQQAQAARVAVPEPPETLSHLVKNLWAEAWKSADAAHEPEREKFARERAEHEKARQEMAAEIRRLEEELERVVAEGETCRATLRKREEELEATHVEQAQATQTAALLQAEVERLLAEGQKAVENLTAWVERATKAETKLEALERAKTNEAGRRDE